MKNVLTMLFGVILAIIATIMTVKEIAAAPCVLFIACLIILFSYIKEQYRQDRNRGFVDDVVVEKTTEIFEEIEKSIDKRHKV